ncbi:MAG: glycosyltransferase [cyanobacterium endosymbiont of Rhopalodia musculus]|uniref:glycosyltransferase n=1 Tax=cyanobacterium endosymbiont of Epithemia clementina EcSB TaxID=3034674 RepID=UPI0024807458|nr:glycosyltransferase [cyanobacterium endosymbiont of Epithemia clementina EcSB]WGT68413.1 glycosyltransferase [cyanobacterium endosymbiont of Epithemia clementina EcSB]
MPADNEAKSIENIFQSILNQFNNPDKVIILVDYCTNNTAEIYRKHRVMVIERQDNEKWGKWCALNYGLNVI